MNQEDLRQYENQLSQVEIALAADPSNAELVELQSELKELIDLTKAALAAAPPAAGPSKPKAAASAPAVKLEGSASPAPGSGSPAPAAAGAGQADPVKFKVGDQVLAKYSDGRFYPAKILSQTGPSAHPVYSVSYLDYSSSAPSTVPLSSLKVLPESAKRKAEKSAEEREKEKKKAKNEKWKEIKESKNAVQVAKQQGWQSFAKKATKKGLVGVKSESIFKTPDGVNSKVGVVGSGRGTTDYGERKKHKFTPGGDE